MGELRELELSRVGVRVRRALSLQCPGPISHLSPPMRAVHAPLLPVVLFAAQAGRPRNLKFLC